MNYMLRADPASAMTDRERIATLLWRVAAVECALEHRIFCVLKYRCRTA